MWGASGPTSDVSSPEWDPLVEDDGLREAELLDFRVDAGRSSVGLILGLKGTLAPFAADTGVVVARQVERLAWTVEGIDLSRLGGRYARYVMASTWSLTSEGAGRLDLGLLTAIDLSVTAQEFDFYAVELDGGEYMIPDYTEVDDATIYAQQPTWDSAGRLVNWSHRSLGDRSP